MTDSGPPTGSTPPPAGGQQQYPAQPPSAPGYPAPQYGYGYPAAAAVGTNGFAIASLICAFLCWPLGLIFGLVSKSQIKAKPEGGSGLATAGIVISAVFAVLTVVYLILFFTFLRTVGNNGFNQLNELNNILNSPTP